ncbi:MAG: ATP-binding protein [Armatimonadota bacterium]|jgi:predicted AAA+ superfamily ATPase
MTEASLLTGYYATGNELRRRLSEPAPGRLQLLTGPRQVGKTTLLLELSQEWGDRALYLAADAPEAALPGWWELQWQRAARLAGTGPALLLVDEVQYLPDWSRRLKAEVDGVYRERLRLHVVATGSAALKLGVGSRETMAGRFERLTLTHWSAQDIAHGFALPQDEAVQIVVRLGGFPGGMVLRDDVARWRAYIRDSIIDPAVGRDLLALEAIRKPSLLRQVFAVCIGHPAEIVSLQKMAGLLAERGAMTTIAHYLELLREAYLVAGLRKFSKGELRRRSSPPKLVPLNNAFITGGTHEDIPSRATAPERWGRLVENACLAHMANAGQTVHYWREEPIEVDAVVEGTWGKWAIEIKTGSFAAGELAGLLEFSKRFRSYRPLVVCNESDTGVAGRAGVDSISWQQFLWSGPGEA